MTPLPAPKPIREYADIDRIRFDAEVRPARQPAIFRGLGKDWPAVQASRQSPEAAVAYLKRFSHENLVSAIVGPPEIAGRFFYTDDLKGLNFQRGRTALDPFLDRLLRDQQLDRPYAMAVQSNPIPELLPGFTAENRTDLLDEGVVPRIWLGNKIQVATHYDLMENIGVVVAGRRRFTVFPPDRSPTCIRARSSSPPPARRSAWSNSPIPISIVSPDSPTPWPPPNRRCWSRATPSICPSTGGMRSTRSIP